MDEDTFFPMLWYAYDQGYAAYQAWVTSGSTEEIKNPYTDEDERYAFECGVTDAGYDD